MTSLKELLIANHEQDNIIHINKDLKITLTDIAYIFAKKIKICFDEKQTNKDPSKDILRISCNFDCDNHIKFLLLYCIHRFSYHEYIQILDHNKKCYYFNKEYLYYATDKFTELGLHELVEVVLLLLDYDDDIECLDNNESLIEKWVNDYLPSPPTKSARKI
jgi:hypothetical protein